MLKWPIGKLSFAIERDLKYRRWKFAIKKCLNWDIGDHNSMTTELEYEDKGKRCEYTYRALRGCQKVIVTFSADPQLAVRCSIPGGVFLISSFALYLVTTFLRQSRVG